MENKKKDFTSFAADAEKNASEFLGKAKNSVVKAVDKNDNGKIDIKDVKSIAGTIGSTAKSAVSSMKNSAEAKRLETERQQLQPIFLEDLDSADFLMPKLIRVTEIDKKRAESDACRGSVGYYSEQKDLRVVNIFRGNVDSFGLTFYPDIDSDVYYIDPSDRDHYIALDDYFNYLKIIRVNELQKIAQDLGAKHFRVIYKEKSSASSDGTVKSKLTAKSFGANVTANVEKSTRSSESIEIAAENIFPGHAPIRPELHYLQREPSVLNLIEMRMDKASPIQHQSFSLALINSSGIKEKDAVKIDAALKSMKISNDTSVSREAKNETRRFLEFEIDF